MKLRDTICCNRNSISRPHLRAKLGLQRLCNVEVLCHVFNNVFTKPRDHFMFWGQLNVPRPRPQTLKNPCVLPSCRLALESDESIFTCDVTQGKEGCLQPYLVNFEDDILSEVFLKTGEFLHNSRDFVTILKFSTFFVWRRPAQVRILRLKMGLFVVSIQDGRHGVVVHRVRVELWATRVRNKEIARGRSHHHRRRRRNLYFQF